MQVPVAVTLYNFTIGLGNIEILYYNYSQQRHCDYYIALEYLNAWCLVPSTCVL